MKEASTVSWGTGAKKGSFNPKFDVISQKSLYSVYSSGRVEINFKWLRNTPSGQQAVELMAKRLRAAGFPIPDDYRERFVGFRPETWVPKLEDLKTTVRDVVRSGTLQESAKR